MAAQGSAAAQRCPSGDEGNEGERTDGEESGVESDDDEETFIVEAIKDKEG